MGCGASAAKRISMGHARVQQRPGVAGLPTPAQRRKLGIGSKQRERVTAVLRAMPLLAHVRDEVLDEIVRYKLPEPFVVSDGTVILCEGFGPFPALNGEGPIDGMFVLLDGTAHVVKEFDFGEQGVWDFRADGRQCPFFGERVLSGVNGTRAATVKAVGRAEVLNIPRRVWTQIFTRAMGRVVEEQQLVQMQREYSVLLEGGHTELADEFADDMQLFARDKDLPVPDVAAKSKGSRNRGRRASVTKVVSKDELREKRRRASVSELDMVATQQRARRQSVSDVRVASNRARRNSVTESLSFAPEMGTTRYQSRGERRKSVSEVRMNEAEDRDREKVRRRSSGRDKDRRRSSDRDKDRRRSSRKK